MSDRNIAAIAALARWRAFGQTLAERAHRQASAECADARTKADAARSNVDAVTHHLRDTLSAPILDLAKLQCVAQMQEHALAVAANRDLDLAEATDKQQAAMSRHLEARAKTRIVENRYERIAAVVADRTEKRDFDRMAELRRLPTLESSHD